MSNLQSADPHAYLKWPRLIMFNLNGALSIAATGVSARCTHLFRFIYLSMTLNAALIV
jgi:hypothetical protein